MINGRGNNKRTTSGKSNAGGKRPNSAAKAGFKKGNTNAKPEFAKAKSFDKKPKPIKSLESEEIRLNKYI